MVARASWWGAAAAALLLAAALPPAAAQPAPAGGGADWQEAAWPPMPEAGCRRGDWLDGAIYMVRTPACSIAEGQVVVLERYTPATGVTETLATFPDEAAGGVVRVVDGVPYLFFPGFRAPQVPVHRWDEACGCVVPLAAKFPGSRADHGWFTTPGAITFAGTCQEACSFVRYDVAADRFTELPARLPAGQVGVGAASDGARALVLAVQPGPASMQAHRLDLATGVLEPGPTLDLPSPNSPLVPAGPGRWAMLGNAGAFKARLVTYEAATGAWTVHPGILSTEPAALVWGHGVLWSLGFSGAVKCLSPGPCVPTPDLPVLPPAPLPTPIPVPRDRPLDLDGDGVGDGADTCPDLRNPDQADRDLDGLGDACDPAPDGDATGPMPSPPRCDAACEALATLWRSLPPADRDRDGVPDAADNCPADPNPAQADLDRDALGDPCDPDRDGDGIAQGAATPFPDNCPDLPNPDQADGDGHGGGDACAPPVPSPPSPDHPADGRPPAAAGRQAARPEGPDWAPAAWLAAGAAAAGALWATRRRWAPGLTFLFTRLAGPEVALQPSRSRLLEAVAERPGIHFNELARRVGCGRGALRHHIRVLERAGRIRLVAAGRYTCVYLADTPADPADRARRAELARRLEALVQESPGLTAAAASRQLGVTYGAAAYHLRRLAAAGALRLEDAPLAAFPAAAPPLPADLPTPQNPSVPQG